MNLDITPDLVHELYDRARTTRRPAETGLALTADGWEVAVWPEAPLWPVAITGEDVDALLDGEEPDSGEGLDEGIVQTLLTPEPSDGTSYLVRDEDGEDRPAPRGAQVVTCRLVGNGADTPAQASEDMEWPYAWWFDQGTARRLLSGTGPRDAYGRTFELWETASGGYVALRTSSHHHEPGESWVQLSTEQAARWLYEADDQDLDGALTDETGRPARTAPPLVVAARALREAADALDVPAVPYVEAGDGTRVRRPEDVEEEALRVQDTAAVLAALARGVVAPELTGKRRQAVGIIADANGGQSGAARRMGVSQPTVANLLK